MTKETASKTPFFDNVVLKFVQLYFRKDRADARKVWKQAELFHNPALLCDDFLDGDTILPATQGFPGGTNLWDIAFINNWSRVSPPPHGHAADILILDGKLKLQVCHDPDFTRKSSKWRKGIAAAEKYNNAYVVGLCGFIPTPWQNIQVQCRMKISPGFHGSTGVWVQEAETFNPVTGIMVKPFRSFGFSYLGEASDPYIRGLASETVIGLSIQDKHTIRDVDVTGWHVYTMNWSWINPKSQHVEFAIDGQPAGNFRIHPFGPAEIQLWADNYQINKGLKIGYLNVPKVDEVLYDWVRVDPLVR